RGEDRRERVVDLVGDTGGELADRRELLGVDELRLRALQLLELAQRLLVEPRIVERQTDLVGRRLDERDLTGVEAVGNLPAEREGAEDPAAAADRDADEAADLVEPDRGLRPREEVRVPDDVHRLQGPPRLGDPSDQPLAHGQEPADLAQPRGPPALALELQRLAVSREQVEARDLVAGDVREGLRRGPEHVADVERAADRLGDRTE